MSTKFNVGLLIVFLSLAIISTYLSFINKIFLLFAVSMAISSFYSLLALVSGERERLEDRVEFFSIHEVESEVCD